MGEKDAAKAPRAEDRQTERRMVAAQAVMNAVADSARDAANEDFLFHLYRGSELLQDNRVHEAKEELEQALTLQPRDPKGQDLLAVVYFRIGLYPRAIQIYEQLERDNPRDASLKLNLALCYLKTGQTQGARERLEEVVRAQPTHKRAWGYLGLAHERLGDLDKALHAFERGGHAAMARRVGEKLGASHRYAAATTIDQELSRAAAAAFEELDSGEISFSLAEPAAATQVESGTWRAVEPGSARPAIVARAPHEGWTVPPSARAVSLRDAEVIASQAVDAIAVSAPMHAPTPVPLPTTRAPRPLADVARDATLIFPRAPGVVVHASGIALVRTAVDRAFAVRLEAIRAQSGGLTTEVMQRRGRGKATGEPFGGLGSPLLMVSGAGELTLGPRPSHALVAFALDGDGAFVREEALLGFELTLDFENGKLALGDGDAAAVVQLQGGGSVLLETLDPMRALEVTAERPLLVRRDLLLGWAGKVLPRALPPSESPSGQRGLISFAGEGTVLVA